MGYPRFIRARAHKFLTRTAGNLTYASTSWGDLTTALDITLEAQVGDVIEYGMSGAWSNEATQGLLDVATIVSGAPVNHFRSAGSSSNDGVTGWATLASTTTFFGGSVMYTVQAGDISNGLVTLRPRIRCTSATTKTLLATVADPLDVWAKNIGPVDPH